MEFFLKWLTRILVGNFPKEFFLWKKFQITKEGFRPELFACMETHTTENDSSLRSENISIKQIRYSYARKKENLEKTLKLRKIWINSTYSNQFSADLKFSTIIAKQSPRRGKLKEFTNGVWSMYYYDLSDRAILLIYEFFAISSFMTANHDWPLFFCWQPY
jgi:hypothetical protein